jgi:hypothetical protein
VVGSNTLERTVLRTDYADVALARLGALNDLMGRMIGLRGGRASGGRSGGRLILPVFA